MSNTAPTTHYFIEVRKGEGSPTNPFTYTRVAEITDLNAANEMVETLNLSPTFGTHYGIVGHAY